MADLAVVGATAVTPSGIRPADLAVSAGRIEKVAAPGGLNLTAKSTVDARGMILMPGAVDPHTHLDGEMFASNTVDDFGSGTLAAAGGGVTTVVDYAFQTPGSPLGKAIERWRDKARRRALIDYGFHVAVLDPSSAVIEELERVVEAGVTSFKIFMMRGFEDRARDFMRFFAAAAEYRAILTIHAEDENLIDFCTRRLLSAGKTGVAYFAASRPPLSEAAAVARAVGMTRVTGAAAYFVHLSSRAAIAEIRRARAEGQNVIAETRPIYLYLTEERFLEPDGERYVGYPPLRSASDRDAIWEALADGTIDVVATDHCSWNLGHKTTPDRFTRIPPGVSNLETMLPMLYSEGVRRNRISLSRMVQLLSSNPARIFGLYPRKGAIVEGADADLVVFDPDQAVVIRRGEMHSRADYDPFEGFEVKGWPRMTISRGEPVVTERKAVAEPGHGRFLPRSRFRPDWRRL